VNELTIKVPAPFVGVADLGFSARYPAQGWNEPLRDVPFIIEGPAEPMDKLCSRLARFAEVSDRDDAYLWTPPMKLSDEICVMAFRDRSLLDEPEDSLSSRNYVWNLVQPLAFTFLRDCVRLADLKLAEELLLVIETELSGSVEFPMRRQEIIRVNGRQILAA
jgi:hypothetical protein